LRLVAPRGSTHHLYRPFTNPCPVPHTGLKSLRPTRRDTIRPQRRNWNERSPWNRSDQKRETSSRWAGSSTHHPHEPQNPDLPDHGLVVFGLCTGSPFAKRLRPTTGSASRLRWATALRPGRRSPGAGRASFDTEDIVGAPLRPKWRQAPQCSGTHGGPGIPHRRKGGRTHPWSWPRRPRRPGRPGRTRRPTWRPTWRPTGRPSGRRTLQPTHSRSKAHTSRGQKLS